MSPLCLRQFHPTIMLGQGMGNLLQPKVIDFHWIASSAVDIAGNSVRLSFGSQLEESSIWSWIGKLVLFARPRLNRRLRGAHPTDPIANEPKMEYVRWYHFSILLMNISDGKCHLQHVRLRGGSPAAYVVPEIAPAGCVFIFDCHLNA